MNGNNYVVELSMVNDYQISSYHYLFFSFPSENEALDSIEEALLDFIGDDGLSLGIREYDDFIDHFNIDVAEEILDIHDEIKDIRIARFTPISKPCRLYSLMRTCCEKIYDVDEENEVSDYDEYSLKYHDDNGSISYDYRGDEGKKFFYSLLMMKDLGLCFDPRKKIF